MKLLLLILAAGISFATTTTVRQTAGSPLLDAGGQPANGVIRLRLPQPMVCQSVAITPTDIVVSVVVGVFSVDLQPNDDNCDPANTVYHVAYSFQTPTPLVFWSVPTSATPLTVADVQISAAPTPSVVFNRFTGGDYPSITDFGAVGDGVTNDSAAVDAACDAGGVISVPPGTYLIGTNTTLAGCQLVFRGGVFSVPTSITLTINAQIAPDPMRQIFTGVGSVILGTGSVNMIYPQWWGAIGDGTTDSTSAINASFTACSGGTAPYLGGFPTVFFRAGVYRVTSTIQWKSCSMQGDTAVNGAVILWNGSAGGTTIERTFDTGAADTGFMDGIWVRSQQGTIAGTHLTFTVTGAPNPNAVDQNFTIRNSAFKNTSGNTIVVGDGWYNFQWDKVRFDNCGGYCIAMSTFTLQNLSSFSLSNFTYDHRCGADADSGCGGNSGKGFINFLNPGGSSFAGTVKIDTGRIEVNTAFSAPKAIVHFDCGLNPCNSLSVELNNVNYQDSAAMADDTAFYATVTGGSAYTSANIMRLVNFKADSLATLYAGATYNGGAFSYTFPIGDYFPYVLIAPGVMSTTYGLSEFLAYDNTEAHSPIAVRRGTTVYPNFKVRSDGRLIWGDGSGATGDVNLYRSSATRLATDNSFYLPTSPFVVTPQSGMYIQRDSVAQAVTSGGLHLTGNGHASTAHTACISAGASSDCGTFTARHTHASGIHLNTDAALLGYVDLWANNSLTAGNTFSPNSYFRVKADGRIYIGASLTCQLVTGSGSPEGVITAPVCSQYMRTDGGSSTVLYIKESGSGNTGWVAGGGSTPTALLQSAENATDNAVPRAVGTSGRTLEQTAVTIDDLNNVLTAGSVSSGVGGSGAGGFQMTQGTAPTPAANTVVLNAPASVTAYQVTYPSAAASGIPLWTNSSSVVTKSVLAPTDDRALIGNGTTWELKTMPDCDDSAGQHLNYDQGTNAFTCGTSAHWYGYFPSASVDQANNLITLWSTDTVTASFAGTVPHVYAYLEYANAATNYATFHFTLPFTPSAAAFTMKWLNRANGTGDIRVEISTLCIANGEDWNNPTYNATTLATITMGANNTSILQTVSPAITGCAALEEMFVKVARIGGDAADTFDQLIANTGALVDLTP